MLDVLEHTLLVYNTKHAPVAKQASSVEHSNFKHSHSGWAGSSVS